MNSAELRATITAAMTEANRPVVERLDDLDYRLRKLEGDVSSSDLTAQAEKATMIVTMERIESDLRAAHKKADDAREKARAKFALSSVAQVAVSAIATAVGAYLAVKGIHL